MSGVVAYSWPLRRLPPVMVEPRPYRGRQVWRQHHHQINHYSRGGADLPYLVGSREDIVVAMDWTDFDGDDQATLALNLVTEHGRAMPLLWLSVWKDELKDQRNAIEDA